MNETLNTVVTIIFCLIVGAALHLLLVGNDESMTQYQIDSLQYLEDIRNSNDAIIEQQERLFNQAHSTR